MKGAFYNDIPVIQAAITEVLKSIPIHNNKKNLCLRWLIIPNVLLCLMESILNK